ncbi:MAG: orotidine-5'-phosphate decarboxylase [Bacteroidales bacterium]|nr:orotidine-5'-phosphate decarboxylase [Bacteroidales bacterium]
MTFFQIFEQIQRKHSFLCIGLDTDLKKIPQHLLTFDDPAFEFNKQIVDATHDLAIAYKPNLAFYENRGVTGWQTLEKTARYIKKKDENLFLIADAKRGDISNTSGQYAAAFFEALPFDAITVAPYMGEDSIAPFLSYPGKWVILLALTSNKGAMDFQLTEDHTGSKLYEIVLKKSQDWGSKDNMMYVVGATQAEMLHDIRKIIPDHFLLVPGIGAQGGSLEDVARYGMNSNCGLIVNSSRGIIYASNGVDFAEKAREEVMILQEQMKVILKK